MQTKDGRSWCTEFFAKDGRTVRLQLWGVINERHKKMFITRTVPGGPEHLIASIDYEDMEKFLEELIPEETIKYLCEYPEP